MYLLILISLFIVLAILVFAGVIHTEIEDRKRAARIRQGEQILHNIFNHQNETS